MKAVYRSVAGRIRQELPPLRQVAQRAATVVLGSDLREGLDRYRGFRHVVRNVYTYLLDIDQIQGLVDDLPEVVETLERDLLSFADFLERTAREG